MPRLQAFAIVAANIFLINQPGEALYWQARVNHALEQTLPVFGHSHRRNSFKLLRNTLSQLSALRKSHQLNTAGGDMSTGHFGD